MIDTFKSELYFLKSSWQNMLGRPLVCIVIRETHLEQGNIPVALISTLKKLKSGYINGTRYVSSKLLSFIGVGHSLDTNTVMKTRFIFGHTAR